MKDIYLLYSCDAWKSFSSMSLVAATASSKKIKKIIMQKIKDGTMEYSKGSKGFEEDLEKIGGHFAFANLDFGYVKRVADGEIQ